MSDGWLVIALLFLPNFILFFWGEYRDKRRRERARKARECRERIAEEFFERISALDRRLDEQRDRSEKS